MALIEIEIEDHLDEVSSEDLKAELENRGYNNLCNEDLIRFADKLRMGDESGVIADLKELIYQETGRIV